MKKTTTLILAIFTGLFLSQANANVIGTEYQNFNPTYSGLDFTTVQSSETLKPCLCNIGLFFNYAKNTLTYSDTYYSTAGNQDLKGQRAKDFLIGADLNVGFGITKFWDIGVSFPFVVSAKNDDPYGVSYFDKFGLTEVRPATKLRFYGDDDGGMAVMLSGNFNTIDNNPFSGQTPGATVNLELIGDTTTDSGTKWGFNLGYRKRNPGKQITNPVTGLPPPFVPFKDSWIGSVAMATGIESWNSDLVAELIGSHSGKFDESDTARSAQQALEFNLGLRHDWNKTVNMHGGLGTKLANAQSSPDVRAYVGVNMSFGPVCSSKPSRATEYPVAVVDNAPVGTNTQTSLSMPVSAKNIEAYRYKIGSTPNMNCSEESGYSDEIPGTMSVDTDITDIPDGGITLCALAKNTSQVWQPLAQPSIYTWIKSRGKPAVVQSVATPVAVVSNHPMGDSEQTELDMPITAVNPMDYQAYRWKIGSTPEMDCTDSSGYSDEISGTQPVITSVKDIPDGGITMCTVAKNNGGVWQSFGNPTIVRWNKIASKPNPNVIQKDGYEVFKLSAEVLFDFDKDNIRSGAQPELDKIDRYLKIKPYKKVVIEGHTDSKGADAYNMNLSQRRAVQVKKWLIEKYGVQGSKFAPKGMGETVPVDTNETDEGRQNNRRVEFKIYR
jgi:outer membrane protein OmpA-like peptidoglycan-associated protein